MGDKWGELNKQEYAVARYVGKMRRAKNRADGRRDMKKSPLNGLEIDQDAAAGELYIAKLLNVWPDLECVYQYGLADGQLATGERYDVKLCRNLSENKPPLLANTWDDEHESTIYILAHGRGRKFRGVGWCWSVDLFDPARLEWYWQGTANEKQLYVMPCSELRPLKELREAGRQGTVTSLIEGVGPEMAAWLGRYDKLTKGGDEVGDRIGNE